MPLSFVGLPLRQAAMVFLPPFITRNEDDKTSKWATLNAEGVAILQVFMKLGMLFGCVAALAVSDSQSCLPILSYHFGVE
jgi:hypothetical protein